MIYLQILLLVILSLLLISFFLRNKYFIIANESLIINKNDTEVFHFLLDTKNIIKISPSVGGFSLFENEKFKEKDQYTRVFYSHGIPNKQTVIIEKVTENETIITKTSLIGHQVEYKHLLNKIDDSKTKITVIKSIKGWSVLSLLTKHLLLKEEHEACYISNIKKHLE